MSVQTDSTAGRYRRPTLLVTDLIRLLGGASVFIAGLLAGGTINAADPASSWIIVGAWWIAALGMFLILWGGGRPSRSPDTRSEDGDEVRYLKKVLVAVTCTCGTSHELYPGHHAIDCKYAVLTGEDHMWAEDGDEA